MKHRGLGSVYQRGETWWIKYYYRGQAKRESSHSTNKQEAFRLLRKRQGEMGQGRLIGPDLEKTTFEDLQQMIEHDYRNEGHRSLARLHTAFRHLAQCFARTKAMDITYDRLDAYRTTRLGQGASASSLHTELAVLKRAFHLAKIAGKADPPPFPTVTVKNARKGFFERHQFEAVRAHLPSELQPLFTVAYHSGWRTRSELLPLHWSQVDFQAGTLRLDVNTTKNDDGRTFPFTILPELAETLRAQRARTTALEQATDRIIPWVFHRNGSPIKEFKGAWKKAVTAAGYPGLIPHDLRRTAVRNLERAGVSRSVATKLTGHKTEAVFTRYAMVNEADLQDGVKKLAALQGGTPTSPVGGQVVSLGTERAHLRHKQG